MDECAARLQPLDLVDQYKPIQHQTFAIEKFLDLIVTTPSWGQKKIIPILGSKKNYPDPVVKKNYPDPGVKNKNYSDPGVKKKNIRKVINSTLK